MSEYFYPLDGRKHYEDLEKAQKDMFQAFKNFNHEIFEKEGALPRKIRELIAIGVAHTTQCPYCIEGHVRAKKAGASGRRSQRPFSSLLLSGRGALLLIRPSPWGCSMKWTRNKVPGMPSMS